MRHTNRIITFFSYSLGLVIIFTPNFILDKEWLEVPDNIMGQFYCRIIYNRLLIFLFGKASILTATFLAVERWYSIIKPIKYRLTFSRRRLWASIFCIWLSSILLQMSKAFKISPSNHTCKYDTSSTDSQAVAIMYVWLTFFLPSFIIWGTFAQIRDQFRKNRCIKDSHPRRTASQRLLGVCAIAACIMTLCWVPVQITYILSRFKIVRTDSVLHQVNQMLAMSNSCLNPWIFCLANKEYRDEFLGLLSSILSRTRVRKQNAVFLDTTGHPDLQAIPMKLLYFEDVQWMNNFDNRYSRTKQFDDGSKDDLNTRL
jgi:hypothetical protein